MISLITYGQSDHTVHLSAVPVTTEYTQVTHRADDIYRAPLPPPWRTSDACPQELAPVRTWRTECAGAQVSSRRAHLEVLAPRKITNEHSRKSVTKQITINSGIELIATHQGQAHRLHEKVEPLFVVCVHVCLYCDIPIGYQPHKNELSSTFGQPNPYKYRHVSPHRLLQRCSELHGNRACVSIHIHPS